MAMEAKLWSVHGLSVELGINRARLTELLSGLKPAGKGTRKESVYLLADVWEFMTAKVEGREALDGVYERARHEKVQADLKELELAKRRGETVEIGHVEKTMESVVMAVRAKLLAIPKKGAVLVIGEKNLPTIESKLTTLVHESLTELAGLNPDRLKAPPQKSKTRNSATDEAE